MQPPSESGTKEILVNGHSIVFGSELVETMRGTPGFTLEVVPSSVINILQDLPSSDFDFYPKQGKPAPVTPQQTVDKARRIALGLLT